MTNTELIAALEAADGPNRELDCAIAVLQGWCLHPAGRQRDDSAQSDTGYTCLDCGADSWGNTGPTGQKIGASLPTYTSSIDAALTLVPEGYAWHISSACPRDAFATIESWDDRVQDFTGKASTPAVAICIAALKAGGDV